MRNRFVIFFLVSLCLMTGIRADALSLEAQSVIESMRAKLNATVPVEDAAPSMYIPGQELASAMTRLRQKLYGIDAANVEVAAIPTTETPTEPVIQKTPDVENYSAGELLAAALIKVRHSQGRTESLRVAMADMDSVSEAAPSESAVAPLTQQNEKPAETVVATETPAAPEVQAAAVAAPAEKVAPVKTVKKSSSTKKNKKKRSKKQQVIVKKTAPAAEKSVPAEVVAGKASTSSADLKSENASSKNEDDKKFNEFIRKYDFKMPENYRIIVR